MDDHKNLAYSTLAGTLTAVATSVPVQAGHGSRFPVPPFNCTIWPVAVVPTPLNAEIVRVTAIATDTLTITRAQEGTSARAFASGDQIANTITDKVLTDIEQELIDLSYEGAHVPATQHQEGDIVLKDNMAFLAVRDTTTTPDPTVWDAIGASGGGASLTYEGDHVPATVHQDGDIVVKDGIAYICVGGPTTATPNPVPWGPAGMMSGYASLDANGRVPQSQLPIHTTLSGNMLAVEGQAAMANTPVLGSYVRIGSFVMLTGAINIAAGFPGTSGLYEIVLPAAVPARISIGYQRMGVCTGYDASTGNGFFGYLASNSGSSTRVIAQYLPVWPVSVGVSISNSAPWVWAQGDQLAFQMMYETSAA